MTAKHQPEMIAEHPLARLRRQVRLAGEISDTVQLPVLRTTGAITALASLPPSS
jgi:hypothetical protein